MISYDGKDGSYEERAISDCYLVNPNASSCYVDSMIFILEKAYNNVNFKPKRLQKQLYRDEMEVIFHENKDRDSNSLLFDASIENSNIETFYIVTFIFVLVINIE